MSYSFIRPDKELKDFVSHFWAGKWSSREQTNATYYSIADSKTKVVFAFKPNHHNYSDLLFSLVQGQTNHYRQFPADDSFNLFVISLYPYAVPVFFDLSASELTNQFIELDTFLAKQGKEIIEKMASTLTTQERVKVISDYFMSKLGKKHVEDKQTFQAIKQINQQKGIINVNELVAKYYLSKKQFERRFKACSGFNPKLYARIVRFESALNNRTNYDTLTDAAYAYGYYDQAHFTHEFKKFSGFSPAKFLSMTNY